jgi:hypothetical protein
MVCLVFPLLDAKAVSEEYTALIVWLPVRKVDVLNEADPARLSGR